MKKITPTGITANRQQQELTITWSDHHTSHLPFGLLRKACPCAECQGSHENMNPEPNTDVIDLPLIDNRSNKIVNIAPVGNYAINIQWEDGHSFGIYNWAYLRALCTCPTCREGINNSALRFS